MSAPEGIQTPRPVEVAAHAQVRRLTESVMYPAHPPRHASAEYVRVHRHLIEVLDEPCWVCGVRKSTLVDTAHNVAGATQMETHHSHVEWALANAVDPAKLLADFPDMKDSSDASLRRWLDGEGNMLVLCDVHHRHGYYGVHSITYPAWVVQRVLREGYDLVSGQADPPANEADDARAETFIRGLIS